MQSNKLIAALPAGQLTVRVGLLPGFPLMWCNLWEMGRIILWQSLVWRHHCTCTHVCITLQSHGFVIKLFWNGYSVHAMDQSSVSPARGRLEVRLATECIPHKSTYISTSQLTSCNSQSKYAARENQSEARQHKLRTFPTAVQAAAVWGGIHRLSNSSQHITQTANTTQSNNWGGRCWCMS